MKNQNRLFSIDDLGDNPNYVSYNDKKKWNKGFNQFINEKQIEAYENNNYKYTCGSLNICDECESINCLKALKEYVKKNNININYKDFNYELLIEKLEDIKR